MDRWYYVWQKDAPQFFYIYFAGSRKHAKGLYAARIGFSFGDPACPALGVRRATVLEIDDYKRMMEVMLE